MGLATPTGEQMKEKTTRNQEDGHAKSPLLQRRWDKRTLVWFGQ